MRKNFSMVFYLLNFLIFLFFSPKNFIKKITIPVYFLLAILIKEWSTTSSNRAPTPAFPVRKETPLPYHPLLFNGATSDNFTAPNYISYR